jgi:ATP-dependent Clp protease ATP-binding subunit ClpA
LQAFDEGWLTDGRGKKVYFSDAIVIMTSNLGSHLFKSALQPLGYLNDRENINVIKRDVLKEMERIFSPEFRNRLDEVVVFAPLTKDEVRTIAERYLQQVETALIPAGKRLIVTPEALEKVATLGYNYAYGARFLKRTVDEKVKIPITNLWHEGDTFIAEVKDDQLIINPIIAELV